MTITTTIPDEALPAWQIIVDRLNAGSNNPPVTIEQFCQIFRDEETARYLADKLAADNAALAQNTALLELGHAVNAASPAKQQAVLAAAEAILAAP